MKEFIEKLIGRLEEQKEEYKEIRNNTHCIITETSECDSCRADHYLKARLKCIDRTIEIINQLAEEYRQDLDKNSQGWIPCSERLPEGKESHKVLVTDEDGIMAVCYFLEVTKIFKVCWDGEEFQGVVAWQPLPAPYQPKGE